MTGEYTIEKPNLKTVFSSSDTAKYSVPKYQRHYIWEKKNWEDFYDDLSGNQRHFIGSIILMNTSGSHNPEFQIIDGQQRLTTLSILLAAFYTKLKAIKPDTLDDANISLYYSFIEDIRRALLSHGKTNVRLSLSSTKKNDIDYLSLMKRTGIFDSDAADIINNSNFEMRKIFLAYSFFMNLTPTDDFEKLKPIIEKVFSGKIISIEVGDASDAYHLFESLNNRGQPLSAIDLIKTMIFSKILEHGPIETRQDREREAYAKWQQLITNIDTYKTQEQFLIHYYNAYHSIKMENREFKIKEKATKSNLIKFYQNIIRENALSVFNDLIEKSKIYRSFINPDNPHPEQNSVINSSIKSNLIDLIRISGVPSYNLLLYVFSEYRENIEIKNEIINFLVKFFVRRHLTDYPKVRDLDSIFIRQIKKIKESQHSVSFHDISSGILDDPNIQDENFNINVLKNKIQGNIFIENKDATRFILCKIEELHFTDETRKDLWEKKKQKYVWTIEHVLPQDEDPTDTWKKMFTKDDIPKFNEFHKQNVHKLGNLTLTRYNSILSSDPFLVKRDKTDLNGAFIGYKNGLYLNEQIKDKTKWTPTQVKKRGSDLTKEVLNLFKFEGESVT